MHARDQALEIYTATRRVEHSKGTARTVRLTRCYSPPIYPPSVHLAVRYQYHSYYRPCYQPLKYSPHTHHNRMQQEIKKRWVWRLRGQGRLFIRGTSGRSERLLLHSGKHSPISQRLLSRPGTQTLLTQLWARIDKSWAVHCRAIDGGIGLERLRTRPCLVSSTCRLPVH